GGAPGAGGGDRLGHAADGELAVNLDLAVRGRADGGGAERQLGMVLGVEEVRAEEMVLEVGHVDVDRVDARLARQDAVLVARLDGAERAAECGQPVVLDAEPDRGVDGIKRIGAGGKLLGRSGHRTSWWGMVGRNRTV